MKRSVDCLYRTCAKDPQEQDIHGISSKGETYGIKIFEAGYPLWSGFWCTLGTHFSCVDVLGFCWDSAEFCSSTVSGDFANALDCLDFASFCWDSASLCRTWERGSSPSAGASLVKAQPPVSTGVAFSRSASSSSGYAHGTQISSEIRAIERESLVNRSRTLRS